MSSGAVVQYHEHDMAVVTVDCETEATVYKCLHVNLDGIPCGYVDTPNGFGPNRAGSHTTSAAAIEQFQHDLMAAMLASQSTGSDAR